MNEDEIAKVKRDMRTFCKNQSKDYYTYENLKPLYR